MKFNSNKKLSLYGKYILTDNETDWNKVRLIIRIYFPGRYWLDKYTFNMDGWPNKIRYINIVDEFTIGHGTEHSFEEFTHNLRQLTLKDLYENY